MDTCDPEELTPSHNQAEDTHGANRSLDDAAEADGVRKVLVRLQGGERIKAIALGPRRGPQYRLGGWRPRPPGPILSS
jgi:hypothetical protein